MLAACESGESGRAGFSQSRRDPSTVRLSPDEEDAASLLAEGTPVKAGSIDEPRRQPSVPDLLR